MDLGGISSSSISNLEGEKMSSLDANREEINGEMGFEEKSELSIHPVREDKGVEESVEPKVIGSGIGEKNKDELSPKSIWSSSNSNLEVNSTPSKGTGLKKWRRIRRDLNKDASGAVDSSLILKRRHSLEESLKGRDGTKVKNVTDGELVTLTPSAGSLRSAEAVVQAVGLDPELVQLMASGGFSIGMDSDNSENQSSKSLTAASVPKPRHEIGFGRERGRTKIVGGRIAGNALQQRAQRGKGAGVDASKKIRGDRVRLEKVNSQSSVESDLRCSNMGFTRCGNRVSNGKHSEKSLNFDGEHGDEAQTFDEVRSGYRKENGVNEDLLREDLGPDLSEENKVRRENFRPSSGIEPFIESFVMLQAAQEALETEIQKIGEIGKATEHDDFDDQAEETESCSPTLEAHLFELNCKIENLQYKLEEASATVTAKELKVLELEDIIKRTQFPKKEASSTNVPIPEGMHDLEVELEDLLKKKIQAEVEFLIVTRTTQSWKILAEDQIALLEEQKSLAGGQAQVMLKLRDAEERAIKLKEQAEELELYCKELLGSEKVLKLQSKVCKFSFCSFIQLLLLFVAFGLFLMQLMPPSDEFVPT